MSNPDEPLTEKDVGAFGELARRPNPNGLIILQVPPFEAMLPFLEKKAGRQFTAEEIEAERAKAPSIVVTADAAAKIAAAREARQRGAKRE